MREFCDNSWLSGCSQSNGIENNQAAMNCMEITSFHYRIYSPAELSLNVIYLYRLTMHTGEIQWLILRPYNAVRPKPRESLPRPSNHSLTPSSRRSLGFRV